MSATLAKTLYCPKYGVVLLILLTMCFTACKKTNQTPTVKLPVLSLVGANTFGGEIDNELWLPREDVDPAVSNLCVSYSNGAFLFSVYCDRISEDNVAGNFFTLYRSNITGPGDYDLTDPKTASVKILNEFTDDASDDFEVISGKLSIAKVDIIKNIISGQFECVVKNLTKNITHEVKSGRFDLQIGYCH